MLAARLVKRRQKFNYKSDLISRLVDLHLKFASEPMDVIQYLATEVLPAFCESRHESVGGYPSNTYENIDAYLLQVSAKQCESSFQSTALQVKSVTAADTVRRIILKSQKAVDSMKKLMNIPNLRREI